MAMVNARKSTAEIIIKMLSSPAKEINSYKNKIKIQLNAKDVTFCSCGLKKNVVNSYSWKGIHFNYTQYEPFI